MFLQKPSSELLDPPRTSSSTGGPGHALKQELEQIFPRFRQGPEVVGAAAHGYRPDVEGLRGVAVLAVLLFHYDLPPVTGGFVGVDVFFVISGYLITGILLGEFSKGTFSLVGFYERRIRRITPALLVVLISCAGLSLLVYLPEDLRLVGDGIDNAALAKSNIFFAGLADDYFKAGTLDFQPVLHTWSLSVEAQFYLLFPGLLLLLRQRPRLIRRTLLGLALLSFAASVWGTTAAPVATFYLLPTRAWELFAGGLLVVSDESRRSTCWRLPGLSWLGLALITASAVGYTRATPFPGLAALPPVLGAMLVLRSGGPGAGSPNPLLGSRPLRLVGRISYSLYLWHWPLLVVVAYRSIGPLDLRTRLGLLALSFGLAALSWWAIERPFLHRRGTASRKGVTLVVALAATLLVVQGGILLKQAARGAIRVGSLPPEVAALIGAESDMLREECSPTAAAEAVAFPCRFGAGARLPTVVLWGNSFARMWAPTLDIDARPRDMSGLAFLRSYCLPFIGSDVSDPHDCAAFNAAALAAIRAHPEFTTVVLGGNWFIAGPHIDALGPTIAALRDLGRRVVVILAPPQIPFSVPHALALAALRHGPPVPPVDQAAVRAAQQPTAAVIADLRRRYAFTVVDPADWLCDGVHCDIVRDGVPLYFDAGHISVAGARRAAGLFDPVFKPDPP